MKIIKTSNFNEELYVERDVATNVHSYYAEHIVNFLNDKFSGDNSDDYYKLVDDDYINYDGYKEIYG